MGKFTEKQFIVEHYQEMLNILNTLKVGVFITDGEGKVLMLNEESERTGGGMAIDDILGRNMEELQAVGYVDESSVLKAIEDRKECRMIQRLANGGSLYLTAVPYFNDDDIELVICTERDITETKVLEKILDETKKLSEKQAKELEYLRAKSKSRKSDVIAKSDKMKDILQTVRRVARLDTTVLISGESGVGKEVIANYIFNMSNRVDKPFVKINCAAIPDNLLESELFGYEKGAFTGADSNGKPGMFEIANEGTLFLDEITEIPLRLQAKLLRVLQERELMRVGGKKPIKVNVRIIAATNVNLKEAVKNGDFREDLYYRLNVFPIYVPPLRERLEDLELLINMKIRTLNIDLGKSISKVDDSVFEAFRRYGWPGNIRELYNKLEQAMNHVSDDEETLRLEHFSARAGEEEIDIEKLRSFDNPIEEIKKEAERKLISEVLEQFDGNKTRTAECLKIPRSLLYQKMKRLGMDI